jgi:hypothetical protein
MIVNGSAWIFLDMMNLTKIHLSASRDWELLNPSSEDHEHISSSLSPPMNSLPSSTEEGDERLKQQGARVRSIPTRIERSYLPDPES